MMFIRWLITFLGGGPLNSIIKEIGQLQVAKLNSATDLEKAHIQERIDSLQVQLDQHRADLLDRQNARENVSALPWWGAVLFVMIGLPFAIHVVLIGIGTWWVSPGNWSDACRCYEAGTGWLEWTRHIPPFPAPFDQRETDVIAFFYGAVAAVGIGRAVVKTVGQVVRGRRE